MEEETTHITEEGARESVEETDVKEETPVNSDLKWYIIQTQSGYENKVRERIIKRAQEAGMEDVIADVHVPSETVSEIKKGKKVSREERFFPGYILVQMVKNDATEALVKKTQGVAGFIGNPDSARGEGRIDPVPLKDEEAARIFESRNASKKKGEMPDTVKIEYEVGEKVKVIDGPFSGLNGVIEFINPDKGKLTVRIEIFGRATPTEIDFMKVKKV